MAEEQNILIYREKKKKCKILDKKEAKVNYIRISEAVHMPKVKQVHMPKVKYCVAAFNWLTLQEINISAIISYITHSHAQM